MQVFTMCFSLFWKAYNGLQICLGLLIAKTHIWNCDFCKNTHLKLQIQTVFIRRGNCKFRLFSLDVEMKLELDLHDPIWYLEKWSTTKKYTPKRSFCVLVDFSMTSCTGLLFGRSQYSLIFWKLTILSPCITSIIVPILAQNSSW